jgi:hypothetical protein
MQLKSHNIQVLNFAYLNLYARTPRSVLMGSCHSVTVSYPIWAHQMISTTKYNQGCPTDLLNLQNVQQHDQTSSFEVHNHTSRAHQRGIERDDPRHDTCSLCASTSNDSIKFSRLRISSGSQAFNASYSDESALATLRRS